MPKLVAYGMLSIKDSSYVGNLTKAMCEICGAKYGSLEEAKKCEYKHFDQVFKSCFKGVKNGETR